MTENLQPDRNLEEELRRLQPRRLTPDFHSKLVRQFDGEPASVRERNRPSQHSRPMRVLWYGAVGLATALLVVAWIAGGDELPSNDGRKEPGPWADKPAEVDPGLPTIASYRNVLAAPPGDLDRLLSRQASVLLPSVPDPFADAMRE